MRSVSKRPTSEARRGSVAVIGGIRGRVERGTSPFGGHCWRQFASGPLKSSRRPRIATSRRRGLTMCGIVGFVDRLGRPDFPGGRVIATMLEALACRGPDGAGVAILRPPPGDGLWSFRLAIPDAARSCPDLAPWGEVV